MKRLGAGQLLIGRKKMTWAAHIDQFEATCVQKIQEDDCVRVRLHVPYRFCEFDLFNVMCKQLYRAALNPTSDCTQTVTLAV